MCEAVHFVYIPMMSCSLLDLEVRGSYFRSLPAAGSTKLKTHYSV
jgi:hypothetical protein